MKNGKKAFITASFLMRTSIGLNQGPIDYEYVACCVKFVLKPKLTLFVEHGVIEVIKGSLMVHLNKLLYILVFTIFVIRFL